MIIYRENRIYLEWKYENYKEKLDKFSEKYDNLEVK